MIVSIQALLITTLMNKDPGHTRGHADCEPLLLLLHLVLYPYVFGSTSQSIQSCKCMCLGQCMYLAGKVLNTQLQRCGKEGEKEGGRRVEGRKDRERERERYIYAPDCVMCKYAHSFINNKLFISVYFDS